jgi:hypothetical protein
MNRLLNPARRRKKVAQLGIVEWKGCRLLNPARRRKEPSKLGATEKGKLGYSTGTRRGEEGLPA